MKFLLVVACCVAVSTAVPTIDEWVSFKTRFGKTYSSVNEEQFRLGVYKSNKQMIEEHNAKYEAGLVTYEMKMNHFGDKLQHEISAAMNGLNITGQMQKQEHQTLFSSQSNARLPSSVDWRKQGAVTTVKNQGQCGGCWAFSATGSLEGQLFIKTGKLISLSEQNLIDCSTNYGNNGCNGGLMSYAFEYIQDNGGIDDEESYPYEGSDFNECRYTESHAVTTVSGYAIIPSGDEDELKKAVATVGPISVAINAGLRTFAFYYQGVYNDLSCTDELNHGVLLVGYGNDGQDYWLVKNSWGTTWGEAGYVKIARNQGNLCGIASMAGYPIL